MERIKNLKRLLAEAKANPENNQLYIEDLKLSIKMFERQAPVEVRNDEIKFD